MRKLNAEKYRLIQLIFLLPFLLLVPRISLAGDLREEVRELRSEIKMLKQEMEEIKMHVGILSVASVDDDPALGDKDAPLTLIEFSDYECAYCGEFARNVYPRIMEEYISKGKIRYVFRDFPISEIHPTARDAAVAANCAGEQGKYWEMHTLLFHNQEALGTEGLVKRGKEVGLDMNRFRACFESGRFDDEIDKDLQEGSSAGVEGTPAFILGRSSSDGVVKGRLLPGYAPFEAFKEVIDAELEKGVITGKFEGDPCKGRGRTSEECKDK